MLPEEVQELLAKLLLFVFSIFVLCFSRAKAEVSLSKVSMGFSQPALEKTLNRVPRQDTNISWRST